MSQYVLDCSVAMRWFYRNEATPATDALYLSLQKGQDDVFVPHLFFTELLNALLMGERRSRCLPAEAEQFFGSMLGLPITGEDPPDTGALGRIHTLARAHGLTSYDATYLECVQRRSLPLATFDEQLREAAVRIGAPLVI